MLRLPEFRRLFRFGFRRVDAVPAEVDAEVEFHLKMRVQELMARGLSESDATAEAARRFGDLPAARTALIDADQQTTRNAARADWAPDLGRDLRFAGRELRRNWSFALVTVVVLGLGVGLTTAVVSLFERMAIHPLPYPNADRLAVAWLVTGNGEHSIQINPDQAYRQTLAATPGVEQADAHQSNQAMVDVNGTPEMIQTRLVTVGMLDRLGAKLTLGRSFAPDDSSPASPLPTVVAYETWKQRFDGESDVVGRTVRIDGRVATIIGVFRAGFDLTSIDGRARAEFWLPLRQDLLDPDRDRAALLLTLAPGASSGVVAAAIDARIRAGASDGEQFLTSFRAKLVQANDLVGTSLRRTLSLLLAAVGLILFVACANVAALLLGQAVGRSQEFGVRAALGAGRGRVVRQLLAESALLGGLGATLGVGVTVAVLAMARRFRPDTLLTIDDVRVSGLTLLIAGVVGLASTLSFGLAPIWAVSRTEAAAALVGRARRTADGRGAGRLRSGLVIGQIAVTLVLLVGAGLLVKSFVRERTLPVGFDTDALAQVDVSVPEREFPTAARRAEVTAEIARRVRKLPGVAGLALASNGPLEFGAMQAEFLPAKDPWPAIENKTFMPLRHVAPDFFAVTGLRIVAGTTFGADTAAHEIIIDEAAAKRVWGNPGAAVGQRVRFGRDAKETGNVVVGVVTNIRTETDNFEGVPTIYFPLESRENGFTLVIRSAGKSPLGAVSRVVRDTDPGLRIRSAATMSEVMADRTASTRFTMAVVAFFSALSLVLALVGLYGVISFAVRQRHFEFGVRLAIGALPAGISAMVLGDGLRRIAAGVVVGLLGSAGLVQLIRGMLYKMSPWDPWVFAGAALLLGAVGLAAAWIPARRASRVDPLVVIRAE